jgi:predicted nucleic acid-binding protein
MIVFADTSALYALLVRDDIMHVRARKCFSYFAEHGVQLLSSSYILVETIALLQRRIGLGAVLDFNTRIVPLLEILWVNREWYGRAIQRLSLHSQNDLSLVDCLSFEIMEARAVTLAYTYDRHFEENGFTIASFENEMQL